LPFSQAPAFDVGPIRSHHPIEVVMKKHNRNTSENVNSHGASRLPIHRETVRIITGQDLALIAGGSTTLITERPTTAAAITIC
jgi:hypothetical protein